MPLGRFTGIGFLVNRYEPKLSYETAVIADWLVSDVNAYETDLSLG